MRKQIYLLIIFIQFFFGNLVCAKENNVLSVNGNKFLNNGKEFILRGVAVGDSHARKLYYKRSGKKDFESIRNRWQANTK